MMKGDTAAEDPSWMDTLDASSKHTHQKLLNRVKNPDNSGAWNAFFRRYYSLIRDMAGVFSRAHGLQLTESDIEDVAMRVMEAVSKLMPGFEYQPGKRAFRGFLATVTYRRCISVQRMKDARPGYDPPSFDVGERDPNRNGVLSSEESRENEAQQDAGADVVQHDGGRDDMGRSSPMRRRAQAIIHQDLIEKQRPDVDEIIEKHDREVGRRLALEKLIASKKLTKRQFQIFEPLAMGVLPADVCSQLGVSTNQIYNARSLAMPFYEKALLEAKKELDSPKELPPALAP